MRSNQQSTVDVEIWRSFVTLDDEGGNAAGVVLDASKLSEVEMQGIAKSVGLSETAFIRSITKDTHGACADVLFFTPTTPVDQCGHATVAAGAAMRRSGLLSANTYLQKTSFLTTEVDMHQSNWARMIYYRQCVPQHSLALPKEGIAAVLGVKQKQLLKDFQPVGFGTDALVGIRSLDELVNIIPRHENIGEFLEFHHLQGMHVFALDPKDGGRFFAHCRNFAHPVGIDEESATGSATGLLSTELVRQHLITAGKVHALLFSQGTNLDKPSEISVSVTADKDGSTVYVGGRAVFNERKSYTI